VSKREGSSGKRGGSGGGGKKRGGYPRDASKRPGKKTASKKKASGKKKPVRGRRKSPYERGPAAGAPVDEGVSSLPDEKQLAKSLRTGRPPKRRNIRAGRGDAAGPFSKPGLGVFTTTLWEYPSQHYRSGREGVQGDKNFVGATPSWVVWQVLKRYSEEGDVVVDPMCGSGTTLDVCADLDREGVGFDLVPTREDIGRGDARKLPLEDGVARVVFVDPPYSTHIDYSDDPACIGKLDAGEFGAGGASREGKGLNAYYSAMDGVFSEAERVLGPGGVVAVYVSDSFSKRGGFVPVGFDLFSLLRERFEPLDIVAVVRGNEKLGRGNFHKAAEEGNFFLRGFNYLLIARKAGTARGATRAAASRPRARPGVGGRVGGRSSYQRGQQGGAGGGGGRGGGSRGGRSGGRGAGSGGSKRSSGGPYGPKKGRPRRGGGGKPGGL